MIRIGQGRDIHRLENNSRPLVIAGITIPYHKGVVSHSDGDVVYHALAEALLGSLALGDLGTFFPDNDLTFKDMDSSKIVLYCYQLIQNQGYKIINIDCNIILEKPKLKDHLLSMRENIANLLNLDLSQVSLKAQTNEKCGEVGNNEAIEATAIVLIEK